MSRLRSLTTAANPIRAVAKFFFEGDRKFFVKGVTYGPFKPDAEGHYLGRPEQVDVDLAQMRKSGLNVVRDLSSSRRAGFSIVAPNAGMRVLITLPWAKHVEFLRERSTRKRNCRSSADGGRANTPGIRQFSVISSATKSPARWCAGSACGG